jgi:transcriptional regulator with XRE-family HTH domain
MKEIKRVIGDKIREAREEKQITQKELGDYLGYSHMGISHFEKGIREMKISDIQKIAEYFGKDLSYFLSTGVTMFRVDSNVQDSSVTESLSAFDRYLIERNKK